MAKIPKRTKKFTKNKKVITTTTSSERAELSFLTNRKLHCWLIFGLSFLLYANTLFHDYTQDDAIVIYDNMYTQQGLAGIPGILKYDTFKGFFKVEGKDKLVSGGRYRPLTLIMFAIEWQLFKKAKKDANGKVMKDDKGNVMYEGRPFIGHLMNILFYALTGIVLYLLILKLLAPKGEKTYVYFVALLTALLFIVHPLHTEVVANIKGRDEIITLLGSLAAAYYSLRAYYENKMGLNGVVAVLFFLALLSKENAITFLGIAPLMYYFFTKASLGDIVKQMIPFAGAAVLFLIIRGAVLGWSLGAPSMELMNNPFLKVVGNQYVPFTGGEKMATIFYTLGKYVQLLLFPHPLTHDYYPRHIAIMSWSDWQVLLSLFIYLAMGFYALRGFLKKDPVSFGILFYLASLSIVSNIVFAVGTNMSERFMFMPSVGFSFILAILAWRFAKIKTKGEVPKLSQMQPVLLAAGIVMLAFSAKTISRNSVWKSNYTLFMNDVKVSVNSAKLRNAAGGELTAQSLKEKDETKRKAMQTEALGHLQAALKIHPNYKNTYLLLGNLYNYVQDFEKSIQSYQKVLQLDPDDKNGYNNLGITYRDAGKYYGEKGNVAKATQYLNEAYKIRGDEFEVLRLLGVLYGTQGNHPKAIEYFKKCVDVQPQNAQAHLNLSMAYRYVQDEANANKHRQRALELDPEIENKR